MPKKIYDRQAGESDKAFEAFAVYRDMGAARSVDAVSQKLSKSRSLIARWSSDFNWVERVSAYDDFVDTQARKQLERDAIKRKADMLKRHALQGKVLQQKAVNYLDRHGIDKGADAINAIVKGIEIERKAENLPDWIFEVVNADDNELARQYAELLAQVASDGSGDEAAGNDDPATPSTETETPASE